MKKIFFTICFIFNILHYNLAKSDVISLPQMGNYKAKQITTPKDTLGDGLPNPQNQEEVKEFFKKRFEEAARTPANINIDWNVASSVGIIHSQEYYKAQEEKNKPLFQKMYEEALRSLHLNDKNKTQNTSSQEKEAQTATRFFTLENSPEVPQKTEEEIATVSVSLPSGRKILAPALEHIPYFLSYIDIQSNGYIKIEDTITIVANNKKFAYGLERIFSKYSENQHNKKNRIEILLNSVTVNDTPVPYTIEEVGDNIILKPKFNQKLESGVYTYKFNYFVNHQLQREENLVYLDWNLTGQPINSFITSANAIVSIPEGHSFNDAQTFIGKGKKYTTRRTNIHKLAKNVIAFSNHTPLLNGENMNIVTVMDKNVFLKDFDKNLSYFLSNWGNIVYASLGLFTILLSFILSLINLKKEQKNNKYNPSYSGSLMRSILVGKYDRIAFVSQLLELYRKDAIDLTNDNNRLFIIRKNTNSSKLTKNEKKALQRIFPKKTTQTEINKTNNILFKKAKKLFEKNINKQIKKYRLIHNIGYVLFSISMLIITEFFISFISINMAQTIIILLSTTLLYSFYIWILRHKFKYILISLPIKLFALLAITIVLLFSSIYIGLITSIIIIAMISVIFEFSRIFNEHNNFINEAKNSISNYREYIISSAEAINLSKDFINQQSNIFALNLIEHFPQNVSNKKYYKLDIADAIKQNLIDII